MRALGRSATWLVFTVALVLGAAAGAHAQVCGDATGDGQVTDTDGVQVLRAAAQLSTTCTAAVCDINGDGEITDTDGVLALRKAAQLPIEENCNLTGGGSEEVEAVSSDIVPFFSLLIPQFPGIEAAAAGIGIEVDDCPDGGTRTKNDQGTLIVVTFDACRIDDPILGHFQFDGSVALGILAAQVDISQLGVTDLDSGRVVVFDGFFDAAPGPNDTVVFDGGPVVMSTPQGDFDMNFVQLTFNQDGEAVSGSGTIEDNDDNFELDEIEFIANGDNTANLVATFDDLTEQTFLLNLITGTLTPVS